ncbi:hypothetical protein VIBNIPon4_410032 [Vibrio nigripulchritudo POn4]|nr:hypothetical protein VIBNIPon4_410032 [Vibrio nigripulchritudo POn4]
MKFWIVQLFFDVIAHSTMKSVLGLGALWYNKGHSKQTTDTYGFFPASPIRKGHLSHR